MRKLPRIGWLAMLMVIALAGLGVGWTLWFEELTINSTVQTGRVSAGFVRAFTDDDDVVNDTARDSGDTDDCTDFGSVDIDGDGLTSCDPAASGPDPKDRYDKDVARCDASVDPNDSSIAHVIKRNVYPSYHCTAWFDVLNDGTIPVKVALATINGAQIQPGSPTPMDLDGDGAADVEVEVPALDVCRQIDPGETFALEVRQHILQTAPQDAVLEYVVKVQLNQWNEPCPPPVPVLEVTRAGFTAEEAAAFATALGLPRTDILAADGSLLYVDPENFQSVPTMPADDAAVPDEDGMETSLSEAFDFAAIREIVPYSQDAALERVQAALQPLTLTDVAMLKVGHTEFEWVESQRGSAETALIGTNVYVNVHSPSGFQIIGAGMDGMVSFDPQGEVTGLNLSIREVVDGALIQVMTPADAQTHCFESFFATIPELGDPDLNLGSPLLVYSAPPLAMDTVKTLYPHYQCGGSMMVDGEEVLLEQTLIPAVLEGAPQVDLAVQVDGSLVQAQAAVSGGAEPYGFSWTSTNVTFDPAQASAPTIEYNVTSREPVDLIQETLCVHVMDANGLATTACESFEVVAEPVVLSVHESIEVGAEWYGVCGGLDLGAAEAGGFVSSFQADPGVIVDFNWGEFAAWERDFKDPSKGGTDHIWVDEVDAVYFTGHAGGNGFSFCGNNDDTLLHYNDALWGNLDHEWLGISACGPLQDTSGGLSWWQRWGPAFDGLHLLAGRANVGYSHASEGQIYADALRGTGIFALFGPQRVRTAWTFAESLTQPSSVLLAYMGVIGPGGSANINDYFWGKGPVSSDIPNPIGFWRVKVAS